MNDEELRKVLNNISNIDIELVYIDFDLYSNDALKKIARALKNRREKTRILFNLGKDEKIEGVTALIEVLQKIKKNHYRDRFVF